MFKTENSFMRLEKAENFEMFLQLFLCYLMCYRWQVAGTGLEFLDAREKFWSNIK